MKKVLSITALFTVFASTFGYAHSGHGTFNGHEIAHYLTSPTHVIFLLVAALLGVYFIIKKSSKQTR